VIRNLLEPRSNFSFRVDISESTCRWALQPWFNFRTIKLIFPKKLAHFFAFQNGLAFQKSLRKDSKILETFSQFNQHLTGNFCTDILLPEIYKPKL